MLAEILLIATLCTVDNNSHCDTQVLDEWDAIDQPFQDRQTDCLGAEFESDDSVKVNSFDCYKMIVDDAQGFTVQSLSTGEMITIFYDDFRGNYGS